MPEDLDNAVLLNGRYFTLQELLEIQETVRMFPKLSRAELAKTICENLEWVTPVGQYKNLSCLQLLEKLESQGLIELPAKGNYTRRPRKEISIGAQTAPASLLEGNVADYEPLALEPVGMGSDFKLWNEYVHRYHTLGYQHPFGASQRYFIVSEAGLRLGYVFCLLLRPGRLKRAISGSVGVRLTAVCA